MFVRAIGFVAVGVLTIQSAEAADLFLRRVLLSTAGLGLYEFEAEVEDDASVELTVRRDQVDDVLKSLVVFDDQGGVGGLDLDSPKPLEETFRSLPFTAKDLQSTPQLLTALRGAEVEVGGARALKGRIVAVAEESDANPDGKTVVKRHRVTVMTESGLEQFVLEQADSVRFADPALRAALAKALTAIASSSDRDSRTLHLVAKGQGKRKLSVAYLAAAPIWKTSYRLVLDPSPDAKKATLQGWATLENFSGQDWKDVDLTLVSGRPVAYRQELYRAYMVQRPEAPLDIGPALTPEVDRGGTNVPPAAPEEQRPMLLQRVAPKSAARDAVEPLGSLAASPLALAAKMAPGAAIVAAQEQETQVSFHLPFPVSVANGRTLSLPIVDAEKPVQRIALFDPATDPHHPLSSAELTNDSAAALPPGLVTIYETSENGPSYVGDARLSGTPAGEKRFMSFALDQKTTINEDDSDQSNLVRARIAKGVMTIDDLARRRTIFHVKADAPRRLVVFAPKLEGGKLTEPKSNDVTEADGRYRVPFDVKAGDGQTFTVTQEATQQQFVGLADLEPSNLVAYAKTGGIDDATRKLLTRLSDLRGAEADADRALVDVQVKIQEVESDQSRIKDLSSAAPAGSDLAKRYLKKLDEDETRLETLQGQKVSLETKRDEARKAAEDFIAGL